MDLWSLIETNIPGCNGSEGSMKIRREVAIESSSEWSILGANREGGLGVDPEGPRHTRTCRSQRERRKGKGVQGPVGGHLPLPFVSRSRDQPVEGPVPVSSRDGHVRVRSHLRPQSSPLPHRAVAHGTPSPPGERPRGRALGLPAVEEPASQGVADTLPRYGLGQKNGRRSSRGGCRHTGMCGTAPRRGHAIQVCSPSVRYLWEGPCTRASMTE